MFMKLCLWCVFWCRFLIGIMLKGIKAIISRFFSVWVKNLYLFTSLVWKSLNISQLYQEKLRAPLRWNDWIGCTAALILVWTAAYINTAHQGTHSIPSVSTVRTLSQSHGAGEGGGWTTDNTCSEPSRAWSPRCASTAGDTGPKNVNPRSVTTELHGSSGLTLRMKKCPCFVHGDQDVNGINLFLVRRELKVSIALCSFCRNARWNPSLYTWYLNWSW